MKGLTPLLWGAAGAALLLALFQMVPATNVIAKLPRLGK